MDRRQWLQNTFLGLIAGTVGGSVAAQAQYRRPTYTVIKVTKIHCEFCARRITGKLVAVPGVREVKVNVAKNLVVVYPKSQAAPSPKTMWNAVKSAGFQMVSLSGPHGSFKSEPKTR